MSAYPSRSPSHILENKSDRYLRNQLPDSWVINKPIDYGLDYYVEIAEDQHMTGLNFSIQLKAHEQLSDKGAVTVLLKRSTINMYLNRLEPVLLVCYIESEDEAFYDWFKDNSVDLTKKYESNYIKINKSNKLSKLDWNDISAHVKRIFSRKFLLNSIPEIDFSTVSSDEEKKAMAHYVKGEFDLAESAYKVLFNKESSVVWLSALAMCQYSLYRYKEALFTINSALEKCDMPELLINKACILAEDGISSRDRAKLLEAKSIFEKAITTHNDPRYYYNYANTLSELGEFVTAEVYYKKTLKANPNYAQAWKNLGELYFRTHQHKRERLAYQNALKIDPDLPEALMSLGILMVRSAEDYKKALVLLNRAVELSSRMFHNFEMGYFWFAKAHFGIGDYQNGFQYIQKGLSLFPGNRYLLDLKREFYLISLSNGDEYESDFIEFLKFRIELDPSDLDSFSLLINLYLNTGANDEALRLITLNTDLLKGINKELLVESGIPYIEYLKGLPSYGDYYSFRRSTFARREEGNYIHESIAWVVELMSLKLYHDALQLCRNQEVKRKEPELTNMVMNYISAHFPMCAAVMYQPAAGNADKIASGIAEAMAHIPIIAMMEAGMVLGNLGARFKLDEKKLDKALSDKKERRIMGEITMSCFEIIQEHFKIFPED